MIGEEVRRRREDLGLTGAQLAARAKLAPSAVSQIETGKRTPSSTSVIKLAAALNVEVGALYPKAQAPLPFEYLAGQVGGAVERGDAMKLMVGLENLARGLASRWNEDIGLYEREGIDAQPYRTFEMSSAILLLSEQFWGTLEALQRHAEELGLDPDVRTWQPASKGLLLEVMASIRALAELYDIINRSTQSNTDQGDFRARRAEFDARAVDVFGGDPQWPEAVEKARTTAGLAG